VTTINGPGTDEDWEVCILPSGGQVLNFDISLKTAKIEIMGLAANVKIQDLTPGLQ
jgi:hypothetical protein